MKAAQRLLAGIEAQHANAATDQATRGRQHEKHVYQRMYSSPISPIHWPIGPLAMVSSAAILVHVLTHSWDI
jgi:hypothetical protein